MNKDEFKIVYKLAIWVARREGEIGGLYEGVKAMKRAIEVGECDKVECLEEIEVVERALVDMLQEYTCSAIFEGLGVYDE